MRYLYSLLLAFIAPFLLFSLYRKKEGKPQVGKRWVEHFGFTPELLSQNNEPPIWLHAVSVGETIAAKPIIVALRAKYPNTPIVLTSTTATGAAIANRICEEIPLLEHRYMPIDFAFCVNGFIQSIRPQALLIMETELWPNTLHCAKKAGLSVVVINARLSKKAAANYKKIKSLFTQMANNIDYICCQFDEDHARFIQLGIKKERLAVTGSMKFDLPTFDTEQEQVKKLQAQLAKRPVWIGSSTHAGEDEILLSAQKLLLQDFPDALLILVPRHPERFNQVGDLVKASGLALTRRSENAKVSHETQVYLADSMGEMMLMFAAADVAFMAGSLLGDKVGGHNLLEPASLAKPLLTGPSYFNFQTIGDELIKAKACQVCETDKKIAHALTALFSDQKSQQTAGKAALEVVQKNRGAVNKTLRQLASFIES